MKLNEVAYQYLVPPKRHVFPAVSALALALAIVPLYLSRKPPVQFLGLRIMTDKVEQGDKLKIVYAYKVNKFTRCDSTLRVTLYDNTERVRMYEGELDESIDTPEDYGPDVYSGISKYIGVPVHAKVGTGRFEGTVAYRCNWVHDYWPITQRLPYLEFQITEKPDPKALQQQIDQLKFQQEQLAPPLIPQADAQEQPPAIEPTGPIGPDKDDDEGAIREYEQHAATYLPTVAIPLPVKRPINLVVKKKKSSRTTTTPGTTTSSARAVIWEKEKETSAPAPEQEVNPYPYPKKEEAPDWLKALIGAT